ncbi:MAG: hypothetical protein L6Q99_13355 [Planctomycetes bacterium]|nr:hypothetical protein [Planctomycetota bacterium]
MLASLVLACAQASQPAEAAHPAEAVNPARAANATQAASRSVQLEAPVGLSARIGDVVLEGSELEVAPLASDAPLVVRITRCAPHGDAFRYDFELVALEPGLHDVASVLRRKDNGPLGDPAALGAPKLLAVATLAEGRLTPNSPEPRESPRLGGYTTTLWLGGAAWLVGLALLLALGRRKRAAEAAAARPATLAEKLEPLVRRAAAGELGREERAALERGLVEYWSRRLGLDAERPEAVLPKLRAHPDSGPLLRGLEVWLHAPGPHAIDVGALLAPYRELAADALELGTRAH